MPLISSSAIKEIISILITIRHRILYQSFKIYSVIEIIDKNIKDFERIARKYGVDFALKKDKTGEIPKYLVFFKARDGDALTQAFKEYTAKTDRKKERPSVLKKLRRFKEAAVDIDTPKVRKKELDAR